LGGCCGRCWADISLGRLGQKCGAPLDDATTIQTAITVAIVHGNVKYKCGKLDYVCKTVEKAASASTAHHTDNKWNPSQNGNTS